MKKNPLKGLNPEQIKIIKETRYDFAIGKIHKNCVATGFIPTFLEVKELLEKEAFGMKGSYIDKYKFYADRCFNLDQNLESLRQSREVFNLLGSNETQELSLEEIHNEAMQSLLLDSEDSSMKLDQLMFRHLILACKNIYSHLEKKSEPNQELSNNDKKKNQRFAKKILGNAFDLFSSEEYQSYFKGIIPEEYTEELKTEKSKKELRKLFTEGFVDSFISNLDAEKFTKNSIELVKSNASIEEYKDKELSTDLHYFMKFTSYSLDKFFSSVPMTSKINVFSEMKKGFDEEDFQPIENVFVDAIQSKASICKVNPINPARLKVLAGAIHFLAEKAKTIDGDDVEELEKVETDLIEQGKIHSYLARKDYQEMDLDPFYISFKAAKVPEQRLSNASDANWQDRELQRNNKHEVEGFEVELFPEERQKQNSRVAEHSHELSDSDEEIRPKRKEKRWHHSNGNQEIEEEDSKPRAKKVKPEMKPLTFDDASFREHLQAIGNTDSSEIFEKKLQEQDTNISTQGNNLKKLMTLKVSYRGSKQKVAIFELRDVKSASRMFFVEKDDVLYAVDSNDNHKVRSGIIEQRSVAKLDEIEHEKGLKL